MIIELKFLVKEDSCDNIIMTSCYSLTQKTAKFSRFLIETQVGIETHRGMPSDTVDL